MAFPAELFSLLESADSHDGDDIKLLVNDYLASSKDTGLLGALVDCFLQTRSQHCLEILVGLREPYGKLLFDKLADTLKGRSRLQTLKLITHIVHKQPPWLHHITNHKILNHVLLIIKGDQEVTHVLLANVIIISLMPMLPVQYGSSALPDTFEAFSSLAALATRKPSHICETHMAHLNLGLQALFEKLYGMYPCNFLAYLRGFYGSQDHSRDNFVVYTKTIRPLLQRTRLHPLLVTASKEAELGPSRWKKMRTYDILAECAKHTLDTPETVSDSDLVPSRATSYEARNSPGPLPAISRLSLAVTPVPGALVDVSSTAVSNWSPAESCGLERSNSATARILKGSTREISFEHADSSPPLDLAVEATPDDVHAEAVGSSAIASKEVSSKEVMDGSSSSQGKEVLKGGLQERTEPIETPFCSTTHTLTVEPHNSVSELPEYEEECQQQREQFSMAKMVQDMSRLRYFSQCLMSHPAQSKALGRSSSCPGLVEPIELSSQLPSMLEEGSSAASCLTKKAINGDSVKADCGESAAGKSRHAVKQAPDDAYGTLLALSVGPPLLQQAEVSSEGGPQLSSRTLTLAEMSPRELLEQHLQVMSENYLRSASPVEAPKDQLGHEVLEELNKLKGEVCLLYIELLYERHRRDVHIERSRRLLAKAKKMQALEEQTLAYKDQLLFQEKEIQELNHNLDELKGTMDGQNSALEKCLEEYKKEIGNLKVQNACLKSEIVEMTSVNARLRADLEKAKLDVENGTALLLETSLELQTAQGHVDVSRAYQHKVEALEKELITLGEIYERLEARSSAHAPQRKADQELKLVSDAAHKEIASVKHLLDNKTCQLEASMSRIKQLEELLAKKNLVITELKQMIEKINLCHKEEMESKEMRITALTNTCQKMSLCILELQHSAEQKKDSSSDASGACDEFCANMDIDGSSPTVDPGGVLGSYSSNADLTPVSDMLKDAEAAAARSAERKSSENGEDGTTVDMQSDTSAADAVLNQSFEHSGEQVIIGDFDQV
ncbi:hamartin-like isoform X2 [Ornithodoros turicata]|uniref:hamartin-like isoform X2 n=1 Tax=Ornithodoros turicata TaxID=34597 RepID=UPI003138E4B6